MTAPSHRFKPNLLANYGGAAFVAAAQVLLIPLYVTLLGQHDWGVLSAVIALSTALLVVETGISLAVARGFSSLAQGSVASRHESFRFIERRYLAVVAAMAFAGISAAAPLTPWLLPSTTANAELILRSTLVMAAAQIVGSLYRSVLVGTGEQVRLNMLLVTFTTLRHAAGITGALLGGGVMAVAGSFALGFVVEAAFRRQGALNALRRHRDDPDDVANRPLSPPATGATPLAIAGTIGAMGTQIDRLVLSRIVDPTTLGYYAIAATLSLAVLQLVYPLSSALLPRLDRFRSGVERNHIVRRSFAMVGGLLATAWIGATLLTFGGLRLWLPSEALAAAVQPLFLVHLLGTTFNALCVPLYLGLLAHHDDHAILAATAIAFAVQAATLFLSSVHFGALAGSLAWCAGNGILLIAYYLLQLRIPRDTDDKPA